MRTVRLGEVCTWGSGGTPPRGRPDYFGDGVPWVSIADLNDGVVVDVRESLTESGLAHCSAKVVPAGTLFVAMYGSIGKLGIASRDMCTSQAIAHARPVDAVLDVRYLFHYLLAQRAALQALGRGGTQMNIGQADLKAFPIPLPLLGDQRRIAAMLDQADAIRTVRRQVLAHLDTLPHAIFHDMFGTQEPTSALGECAEIQGGLQVSARRRGTHDAPYLRVANVYRDRLDLSEVKTIRATEAELRRTALATGDLLFVEGHANPMEVGRVAVWSSAIPGCVHQNHLIRARLDPTIAMPVFVSAWFNTDKGAAHFRRAAGTTSGLNTISASVVRSAPIPVPPLHVQHLFAARTAEIAAQRTLVQTALARDDELFAALQSRAFGGS